MRIAVIALALIAVAIAAPRPRHPRHVDRRRPYLTPEGAYFAWLLSQP